MKLFNTEIGRGKITLYVVFLLLFLFVLYQLFSLLFVLITAGVISLLLLTVLEVFDRWYVDVPEKPYAYALLILGEYYREGTSFWDYLPHRKESLKKVESEKLPIPVYPGGKTFFWFYPFFQCPVLFDMSDKNFSGNIENVRTHDDRAPSRVPYEITWYVDKDNIRKFIETAGRIVGETKTSHFEKVQKILHGMISDSVRELASIEGRGPKNWEELQEASEELVRYVFENVIKSDAGDETEKNLSNEEKAQKTKKLKGGDANFRMEGLGIVVKRFNIPEVEPPKDIANAKEKSVLEEKEAEYENIQFTHIDKWIDHFSSKMSPESACDLVLLERDKAKKIIYSGGNKAVVIPGLENLEKGGK